MDWLSALLAVAALMGKLLLAIIIVVVGCLAIYLGARVATLGVLHARKRYESMMKGKYNGL